MPSNVTTNPRSTTERSTSNPTFVSFFAGVGGFDMGVESAGFDCVAQVEWDDHCQTVLARHWPDVPRWGDIQTVSGYEIPPADLVIFGSPCQDLSVAGKRQGLDGGRSSMFYEATRVIKEMRDGTDGTLPRVVVWENVAGALFSNGGADFGKVLDEMADLGALVIEWAVLDARYFGVPQRRRRIFLVAIFDPALADRCPEELLPVGEGRRRNPSASKEPRTGSSGTSRRSVREDSPRLLIDGTRRDDLRIYDDESPTLTARMGTGGGNVPLTMEREEDRLSDDPILYAPKSMFDENWEQKVEMITLRADASGVAYTLLQPVPSSEQEVIAIQGTIIGRSDTAGPQGRGVAEPGDPMYTLDTVSQHAVLQPIEEPVMFAENQRNELRESDTSLAVTTGGGKPGRGYPALRHGSLLRKLLPIECERLMGWPDDHTRYRADGTEVSDAQRYKMCGNGVASPVAEWVARQIRPLFE